MAEAWGLGILLILLLFIVGDVSRIGSFPSVSWAALAALFISHVGFTVAHNFRWKGIVENLPPPGRTDFFPLFRSLVDSYAIGKIIPMDASLLGVRSYYLTRVQKTSVSMAVFSVLLDRFLDIILFLIMAIPSFLLITKTTDAKWSFVVLILLLLGQGIVIGWKKGETFIFFASFYRFFLLHGISKIPFLSYEL